MHPSMFPVLEQALHDYDATLDFMDTYFFRRPNQVLDLKSLSTEDIIKELSERYPESSGTLRHKPRFVKYPIKRTCNEKQLDGFIYWAKNHYQEMYYYILEGHEMKVYGNDGGCVQLEKYDSDHPNRGLSSAFGHLKAAMIQEIIDDFAEFIPVSLRFAFKALGSSELDPSLV